MHLLALADGNVERWLDDDLLHNKTLTEHLALNDDVLQSLADAEYW